jgi:hypothetical protein
MRFVWMDARVVLALFVQHVAVAEIHAALPAIAGGVG